jgi:peptidoglycan hydrolase-like protein with peptidoglycan-binding domain
MAKYPVAGTKGKSWKVTSPYGWRVHPISKAKKHHNGVDIWQAKEPTLLRACFAGTVVGVSTSTDPNGAGNKVIVQSTVNGKKITWTYFHMVKGSIKVKKGQVIAAGEIVGKMGETGFATGKHLHWEIWSGHRTTQPNINGGGKGFLDPMKFMKSVLDVAKPLGETETPPPVIGDPPSVKQSSPKVLKETETIFDTPKPGDVRFFFGIGSKGEMVKKIQKLLGITSDGIFGQITEASVKKFQLKKGIKVTGIVDTETWNRLNK